MLRPAWLKAFRQWPLPALLVWGLAWISFVLLAQAGAPEWVALSVGAALGAVLSRFQSTRTRRFIVALGFPLSLLASGFAGGLPAWGWLLPLALLAFAYPRHAWHDAPWFPTPPHALDALERLAPLTPGAAVLDAGCGLGHGLRALRRAYPQARIVGIEWSGLLSRVARLACPWAEVRRGDMWQLHWAPYDLVYLFQRPESMTRAWNKAKAELSPGAWLVSLEFEIAQVAPVAKFQTQSGKTVRLYRVPQGDPA